MSSTSRRGFLSTASALSAWGFLAGPIVGEDATGSPWSGGSVENDAFRLVLSPREGLRHTQLIHLPSGLLLADGDYSYSFGKPEFSASHAAEVPDGTRVISLSGPAMGGPVEVLHEFRIPHGQPWLEEQITLTNRSAHPLDLTSGRCGFLLPLTLSGDREVAGPWSRFKLTAIPFRRALGGYRGQYADFPLGQVLTEEYSFEAMGPLGQGMTVSPEYAAEGWAWTDGERGFLVIKYGQQGMEWSVVDRTTIPNGQLALRWGGYGLHHGDPAHGAWLQPGESHQFGVTKLIAYAGGMAEGFYAFRQEMAARGHGCPPDFDPPVHWNELYDNHLWWLPDDEQGDPAMRKKYYTLADMKAEASKARAIGCEALYLDPGWDTRFGSKIWDEARLGPCKDFVAMLKRDYGLELSLHTPLSAWCDPRSYSEDMYRVDRFGQRLTWEKKQSFGLSPLCGASRQYQEETARRLKVLARDGAVFFMFDGNYYRGECWDPQHGHIVPARREEHVQGMCRLARMVHEEYPHVLVEMHSPDPVYYGHGRASADLGRSTAMGFDSVWAFELMWQPMDDLLSGRSLALYYYSLAYALPLYIHIDLRTDNVNALVFWWNASTCRHLGIGGTHPDPRVQVAHKSAMSAYRRLKPCYAAGTFYGLDEVTHLHKHPREPLAAINCFNLEDRAVERTVKVDLARIGLDPRKEYQVEDVPSRRDGDAYIFDLKLPPLSHQLRVLGLKGSVIP